MPRRRTYTRTCTAAGCRETSFIEYTTSRQLEGLSTTWKCYRHSKPNEVLSAANPETDTVLSLHPLYSSPSYGMGEPTLIGHFWGPEDADKGHHGIVSGPGFRAVAKDFPPGTRLIVTARIELPTTKEN